MKISTTLALAAAVTPAAAFAPLASSSARIEVSSLDACIPKSEILKSPDTTEMGKIWDPFGLAEIGSDETLAWFRHSEIKHGRIVCKA